MKSIHTRILCILLFIGTVQSCTEDFENINDNPNFPTVDEANPALLLPKILYQVGNEMTAGIAWGQGNIIAQLVATNNFTGTDRYLLGTNSGTWNTMYINIRDANNLLTIGESLDNKAYQGAALTLRAWMLANLTDMYGDVPYTEALKGKEDAFLPAFDAQEQLYTLVMEDLKRAAVLSEQGGRLTGDILYNGDTDKWVRLANSLRIRYIMRLEKKWAEIGLNGSTELQALVDGGQLLSSNDDNGAVPYLSSTNRWPLNTARVGSFDEKRMSQRIEMELKRLNDPRMPILFRPVDNPDSDEYVGVPNGLSEDAASNFNGGANNQSRLGTRFREEPASVEMMIMHYSELQFLLAEAAQKGYMAGEADIYYRSGIMGNMSYLGVEDIGDYMNQSAVALGDEPLEKIALQKWLSLFMVGNEAWYDIRRTELPALTPGPNAILSELPVRIQYPESEQVLNAENYKAAISRQGPDEITTRMWLLK